MIKLVLSDLDGTIVPFGGTAISQRTRDAVLALERAGIRFAPATGRPPRDCYKMLSEDEALMHDAILSNGRMARVDGRYREFELISKDELVTVFDVVSKYETTYLCLEYEQGEDPKTCSSKWVLTPAGQEEFDYVWEHGLNSVITEFSPALPEDDVHVAGVASLLSGEKALSLQRELRESSAGLQFLSLNNNWMDILPYGHDKASGARILARELGIGLDEILFMGDSDNDLALFSLLENTVRVERSTDAAKQAARYRIGGSEDDAPAQLMEQLAAAQGDLSKLTLSPSQC